MGLKELYYLKLSLIHQEETKHKPLPLRYINLNKKTNTH